MRDSGSAGSGADPSGGKARAGAGVESGARPELTAYHTSARWRLSLEPAPRWRAWMNETDNRMANRCLPLLVANESGWVILNPLPFQATWTGHDHPDSVTIEFASGQPAAPPVKSHFGYGVITWTVPYLFRTPPGYNLLARGPANWPKDGITALEGLVETDWAVATFTMNWKLTRPNHPVAFEEGEPFCMVLPQRRGELESFRSVVRDIRTEPQLAESAKTWAQSRREAHVRKFLGGYSREYAADLDGWERDYFKGTSPNGTEAPEHQTKRRLSRFDQPDS